MEDLTRRIVDDEHYLRRNEWCTLDVMVRKGVYFSIDNRRLLAMKQAQERLGQQRVVNASIRAYHWPEKFDIFLKNEAKESLAAHAKFADHLSHSLGPNDGKHIEVMPWRR